MGSQPEMPSKAGRRGLRPFSQDTKKTQKIAVVHRVPVPPGPLYLLPAPQGHRPGRLSRIPGGSSGRSARRSLWCSPGSVQADLLTPDQVGALTRTTVMSGPRSDLAPVPLTASPAACAVAVGPATESVYGRAIAKTCGWRSALAVG